ncbi:MAG: amino acid ABC transporter substrate-binding protein [Thermoprotei archaeon]|nr:MAG: amino acid ABC transporter substrate-binding protein [Thermoprotei archaeon]
METKTLLIGLLIGLVVGYAVAKYLPVFQVSEEKSLVEKIKARGYLVVGTSADWPPFEYINKKGGYSGIDIEIAKKIAEALGVELKIKDIKFDALIAALKTGEIDLVIADMTPTAEREREVDLSIPYFNDVFVVVSLKTQSFSSLEDLYGKTVGVQQGSTQASWVEENLGGKCGINYYTKVYPDMVFALKRGDVDAIIIAKTVAQVLSSKDSDLEISLVIEGTEEYAAIALPQGAEDLKYVVNSVIENIKKDGTLEIIVNNEIYKWLTSEG